MSETEFCIKTGLFYRKDSTLDCYTIFGIDEFNNSNLVIPSKYKGLEVKAIEEDAFYNCQFLESIVIPETVTKIAAGAFSQCYNLKSITMPSITDELFTMKEAHLGCLFNNDNNSKNKNNLYVPASLKKVTFTNGDKITDYCFYECNYIEEIHLPETVKEIGTLSFYKCKSMKEIVIPNEVTTIKSDAFLNCETISRIVLPDNLVKLESGAFENCLSLKNIIINKNIKVIENRVFEYCKELEEIDIPSNIEIIKKEAFSSCYKLKKIKLPKKVIIELDAFEFCDNLTDIVYSDKKEELD